LIEREPYRLREESSLQLDLTTGSPVRWFVLGFDPAPLSKRALKKHVDGAIDLFLRTYGSESPKSEKADY
jgi:hypothetical protein